MATYPLACSIRTREGSAVWSWSVSAATCRSRRLRSLMSCPAKTYPSRDRETTTSNSPVTPPSSKANSYRRDSPVSTTWTYASKSPLVRCDGNSSSNRRPSTSSRRRPSNVSAVRLQYSYSKSTMRPAASRTAPIRKNASPMASRIPPSCSPASAAVGSAAWFSADAIAMLKCAHEITPVPVDSAKHHQHVRDPPCIGPITPTVIRRHRPQHECPAHFASLGGSRLPWPATSADSLRRPRSESDRRRVRLAGGVQVTHGHGPARGLLEHDAGEVARVRHCVSVDCRHRVSGRDAGSSGGAV